MLADAHFFVYVNVVSMAGEKKGSPDHTILRQPRQPIHKPCLGLHKEHELMNVQDKVERKTKEVKRKVVVRSPYFQQKQVEKNACDEKQEQLSSGIFVDERKNGISGGDLCSSHLKNKDLKRKASPNDNTQNVRYFFHIEPFVFFNTFSYYIHVVMV